MSDTRTVLALNADLIWVLQGATIAFSDDQGGRVEIRLMTSDEYRQDLQRYADENPDFEMPPEHRIQELTRKLPS